MCALTSWFQCDAINIKVYCSAHEHRVVARWRELNNYSVLLLIFAHADIAQKHWLFLTVLLSQVRCWSEDVQIIVQTAFIEAGFVRLCFFFPACPSAVKHIYTKRDPVAHMLTGSSGLYRHETTVDVWAAGFLWDRVIFLHSSDNLEHIIHVFPCSYLLG